MIRKMGHFCFRGSSHKTYTHSDTRLRHLVVSSCLNVLLCLQGPQDEAEQVMGKDAGVPSGPAVALTAAGRRRNLEFEPLSTTALILEDRPA